MNSNKVYTLESFHLHRSQTKLTLPAFIDPLTEAALEKIPRNFPQKPDSRKAAFARILLRSGLAQIKHASKKSSAQNLANEAEG
jgi:hypothetical protein